jgi:hypothetical protein
MTSIIRAMAWATSASISISMQKISQLAQYSQNQTMQSYIYQIYYRLARALKLENLRKKKFTSIKPPQSFSQPTIKNEASDVRKRTIGKQSRSNVILKLNLCDKEFEKLEIQTTLRFDQKT